MLSIERARILKNAAPLIEKVKSLCQRRGANGFQGLARMFRIFDDNNDLIIDLPELRTGLSDYGIELSPDEVSLLQSAFDRNGDGRINMNEFLMTIRGTLNSFRRKLVLAAFQKFDRNGNGIIETDDLIGVYSAKNHHLVQEGKMTEADVLREFLLSFDDVCYPDGVVHWIEFESYYAGVSANIDNDEYFDLMMRNAWNLTDDDIRAVTRNQVEVVTSHLQNNTENSNGKSLVGKSMNNESYCSRMMNEESNNSTQLYSTVRSIQHQNKPTIPRRIVGYTGHIPGSADRFAESFNIVQEHARVPPKRFAVTSMQAHPLPTMVKKISRANAHSYRLE